MHVFCLLRSPDSAHSYDRICFCSSRSVALFIPTIASSGYNSGLSHLDSISRICAFFSHAKLRAGAPSGPVESPGDPGCVGILLSVNHTPWSSVAPRAAESPGWHDDTDEGAEIVDTVVDWDNVVGDEQIPVVSMSLTTGTCSVICIFCDMLVKQLSKPPEPARRGEIFLYTADRIFVTRVGYLQTPCDFTCS